jgi:hypothetical protein
MLLMGNIDTASTGVKKTFLTEGEVLELLRAKCAGQRLRAMAMKIKVSHGYLGDVLVGQRPIGPSILSFLNLEKRTVSTYHRKRKVSA